MQNTGQPEPMAQNPGYAPSSANGGDHSPTTNLALLKNLSAEKKHTKDGQPPKRRGPKPDSKPALTRRQELNRQAQRTHRERKEMYIKALEQEVLRLKDVYAETTRERDRVFEENNRLKALLAQHGISYDFGETPVKFQRSTNGYPSSSGSISGSYPPPSDQADLSPPQLQNGQHMSMTSDPMQTNSASSTTSQQTVTRDSMAQLPSNHLDYDQIGIDFVLTYDSQGRPIQVPPVPYPSPPPQ